MKFPHDDLIKFKTINSITCVPSKLQEKIKEMGLNIDKLEIKRQPAMAIAMNALCPCGSGRMFKRCCVDKEREVTYIIQESKAMSKLEYDGYVKQQKQTAINKIASECITYKPSDPPSINVDDMKRSIIKMEDEIIIPEHMKICPICGEPPKLFTGPPWFEMICINKHLWHICLKHNTIIMGPPNRKATECECQK